MAIRQALEDRGVGVGYMVTTGNEPGLETPDLMSYFAADPSIRVIVVYLEGVRRNTRRSATPARRHAPPASRSSRSSSALPKAAAPQRWRTPARSPGSIETFDADLRPAKADPRRAGWMN